jgi:hypothetical protein
MRRVLFLKGIGWGVWIKTKDKSHKKKGYGRRAQSAEIRAQSAEFRIRVSEFQSFRLRLRAQSAELRVRS